MNNTDLAKGLINSNKLQSVHTNISIIKTK